MLESHFLSTYGFIAGNNHQAAISLFKQEYQTGSLEDAKKLAMKVLSKTLDVKLSADKGKLQETNLCWRNPERWYYSIIV